MAAPGTPSYDADGQTTRESRISSITFEWRVDQLKKRFGETTAKARSASLTSPVFGESKWRLGWCFNDGFEACEIYLEACATGEEELIGSVIYASLSAEDRHQQPSWERAGTHTVSLEVRSLDRAVTFAKRKTVATKSPKSFVFSSVDYGMLHQNFWSRDAAFYKNPITLADDAFLVICHISTHFSTTPAPVLTRKLVPSKAHLMPSDLFAGLADVFNEPTTADVAFVVKPDHPPPTGKRWRTRRIYAIKALLMGRSEYFRTSFTSGFAEVSISNVMAHVESRGNDSCQEDAEEHWAWDEYEFDETDYASDGEESEGRAGGTHSGKAVEGVSESHGEEGALVTATKKRRLSQASSDSRAMSAVVVTDISFSTLRAVLYYLYTDRVSFLPLAPGQSPAMPSVDAAGSKCPAGSANAIYLAADKYGLEDLKKRALEYITTSLAVDNISHQLFGGFTQLHPEFKEVEMAFILKHWGEVRDSAGLKRVMEAPDRYAGFADVLGAIFKSLGPSV